MRGFRTVVLVIPGLLALSSTETAAQGWDDVVQASRLSLLLRNAYFNRDKTGGRPDARDWTQGLNLDFRSGYTPGVLGVGLDAFAYQGLRLDASGGKTGTGNLPVRDDGEPAHEYAKAGAALKLRVSRTELKLGEQRPDTPVFGVSHFRIVPQTATGLSLRSQERDDLLLEAGHFYSATSPVSTNADGDLWAVMAGVTTPRADYLGGRWQWRPEVALALYGARFDDLWYQGYANLDARFPLAGDQAAGVNLTLYRSTDQGRALAGEIDNLTLGASAFLRMASHRFTLGLQQVRGDTPFDYLGVGDQDRNGRNGRDQGASIWLPNSAQFSDFNGPHERSWQLRYDYALDGLGWTGASLMARYVEGSRIDGSQAPAGSPYAGRYGSDDAHRETNLEFRYVVASGPARGLSIRLRQAWHRADAAQGPGDLDDFRLVTDYPLEIF
ncbi:outer membrane porin, OprD family [Pseudomonas taiwanensis]|uniref:OprD family porin n=1 Tax=Pseudomonas taiwanensis TaxID=470150 RepID=UPI0015BF6956|nr:OprD family porin [Pseudomonas taiwanensis]NWL77216.1 outer membrane porin, OprD family [Pseudomonas taiwanensis]